ncbi:MAG TPA: D-aminoacyl-tRNA deacylase [Candidatus Sulfotelmatobacter sp.]|nr:D-aminoacyl-tRNA deacylase [Candidatus Sulfotelmatobacter sp.]
MRAVVQRVKRAEVRVNGRVVGAVGEGMVVLLGVGKEDNLEAAESLAEKIVNLRIYDDEQGRMNRSIAEIQGSLLCVSQFTLYGDCRKGRRPSYDRAARPDMACRLYEAFVESVRARGITVQTGQFQALMEVELVNDGPVTLLLDSERVF